jgi:iron complex transport system permease protein
MNSIAVPVRATVSRSPARLAIALLAVSVALGALGLAVGSLGWEPLFGRGDAGWTILWEIRLPRTLGAWLAGALLGLSGAVAQGIFRNPLADPYLMGSSTGATLGIAVLLVVLHSVPDASSAFSAHLGFAGAAFIGSIAAVAVTVTLARGVQQTLRLLLAGVIVGMVFGALSSFVAFVQPEVLRSMQAFILGTTSFIGWASVGMLACVLVVCAIVGVVFSPALDALALGELTAASLGIAIAPLRLVLVAVVALSTGAAVAEVGLVAFIGLMAPHLVRARVKPTHRWLVPLAGLAGGALLLAADVLARWLLAPREVPVGILTAVLGGGYLLWLMRRRPS